MNRLTATIARNGVCVSGVALALLLVPALPAQASTQRQFLTINIPGAVTTLVYGVNDAGVLTGVYNNADGVAHGYVLAGTQLTRFDPPGSTGTFPSGINDDDSVVGTLSGPNGTFHGFLRSRRGVFTVLNDPAAPIGKDRPDDAGTRFETLNDHGVAVGYYPDGRGVWHAFVYRAGVFTRVDAPGAGTAADQGQGTFLTGNNDVGVLVGYIVNRSGDANGF